MHARGCDVVPEVNSSTASEPTFTRSRRESSSWSETLAASASNDAWSIVSGAVRDPRTTIERSDGASTSGSASSSRASRST